eukprot:c5920_g1_i1.p1 GENE.c5920_g1_i1~~c5920_g1_i1.p1  ORF type:complete len:337 (-),score=82.68 c5920_g1_i1:40-1050(-)
MEHTQSRDHTSTSLFSAQLKDVWLHVIGPLLNGRDVIELARVCKTAWVIAHSIPTHVSYVCVPVSCLTTNNHNDHTTQVNANMNWNNTNSNDNTTTNSKYLTTIAVITKAWPHIKLQAELFYFSEQSLTTTTTEQNPKTDQIDSTQGFGFNQPNQSKARTFQSSVQRIACLKLWQPCVFGFEIFGTDFPKLEELVLYAPKRYESDQWQSSLSNMLVTCSALTSLTLTCCFDSADDLQWLLDSLSRLTRISHLDLQGNHIGPAKMKQLSVVLSRMSNLTSLNLSENVLGPQGIGFVVSGLADSQLFSLNLGWNGLSAKCKRDVHIALAHVKHIDTFA